MVFFNIFCSHYYRSKAKQSNRQGGARAVDLPARSFDLAHPGVAPPLIVIIIAIYYGNVLQLLRTVIK